MRADPAWMAKSESYRAHAHQKNDELNREELQRRWGRFKKARARTADVGGGTPRSVDVASKYGSTEAPVDGNAEGTYTGPFVQLREGLRSLCDALVDEALD